MMFGNLRSRSKISLVLSPPWTVSSCYMQIMSRMPPTSTVRLAGSSGANPLPVSPRGSPHRGSPTAAPMKRYWEMFEGDRGRLQDR